MKDRLNRQQKRAIKRGSDPALYAPPVVLKMVPRLWFKAKARARELELSLPDYLKALVLFHNGRPDIFDMTPKEIKQMVQGEL